MEEKIIVLLTLIDNRKKLCKKSLSKPKIKKDPYSLGFISGEFRAIETIREFIEEIRSKG